MGGATEEIVRLNDKIEELENTINDQSNIYHRLLKIRYFNIELQEKNC